MTGYRGQVAAGTGYPLTPDGPRRIPPRAADPLQAIPYSLFPIPYSLFPIPYSLFPIPYSLFPVPCFSLSPLPYNSICAPSSTTRFGGRPKNDVALRAFRDITENSCSRHIAIPGFLDAISVSRPRK